MAISDEITRLQSAKADLKAAIENKGVTVPSSTKLDGYADLVENISGGSIEDLITKENLVKIEAHNLSDLNIVLNQNNNFNITGASILGSININKCEISFSGFSLIWYSVDSLSLNNKKETILSIGNVDFTVENVQTYVNGWKHIYFYINDEIVGTVAYDD